MPQFTIHHWIPKSRGGTQAQTVQIPMTFHEAYHKLFMDLTPEEAEEFLMTLHIAFRDFKVIYPETIAMLRKACRRES